MMEINSTEMVSTVHYQSEEEEQDAVAFLRSIDWQVYKSEMVYGDYISVMYAARLDIEQASEFYKAGLSQIEGLQVTHANDGGIIVTARRLIYPADLGDASKFANIDPPAKSWMIPAPEGITYFDFQRASIWELIQRPIALLADDMGLGKTIQACGMLNYLRPDKVCIVAPVGMKSVWRAELKKWIVYDIPIRMTNSDDVMYHRQGLRGIFITNYEALRNPDAKNFIEDDWQQTILDESHRIKNPDAKVTRAILGGIDENGNNRSGLQAPRKLMMTGTPMPNRAEELWTTFAYLYPKVFTSEIFGDYKRSFAGSGSRVYVANSQRLKKWFRAVTIRRRKSTALQGLPPKKRTTQMVSVSAQNMTRLHEMENHALADIWGGWGQSISFERWSAIRAECARIKAANNSEFVIRFLMTNPLKKLVVFRHHEVTRKAMSEALTVMDIPHVYYEGGMSTDKKFEAVEQFQNNPTIRVIIVSITAGGLGITLTAAHHAVFAEIDCVPSKLLQCEDRLHRISQEESVNITYTYIHGSIEEYMAAIVSAKLPQIEEVVDDDDVKREHIVEAELDIFEIFDKFREDQQGWNRLFAIWRVLMTETTADGYGGLKRKYADYHAQRFTARFPEYHKGDPRYQKQEADDAFF